MQRPDNKRVVRLRRLRATSALRRMVRETRLVPADLVYPLFVTEGAPEPVPSMPGVARLTVDEAVREATRAASLGISGILLFGIPANKDELGRTACDENGIVPNVVRAIRAAGLDIAIITDVCLCAYTSHGHCGVLSADGKAIANDESLKLLAEMACIHASSGADIVAPSAMMDHQVAALREALDAAGHLAVAIMSYSAKYASAFYGPFRDAASGAPKFGDRKTYQMDPGNALEAVRETQQDIGEGADMVMVKPALAYLDVIRRVRDAAAGVPLAAYNVSGEYAMVKHAAAQGLVDERSATLEVLRSIRRAGADLIITYHALEVANWLKGQILTNGH